MIVFFFSWLFLSIVPVMSWTWVSFRFSFLLLRMMSQNQASQPAGFFLFFLPRKKETLSIGAPLPPFLPQLPITFQPQSSDIYNWIFENKQTNKLEVLHASFGIFELSQWSLNSLEKYKTFLFSFPTSPPFLSFLLYVEASNCNEEAETEARRRGELTAACCCVVSRMTWTWSVTVSANFCKCSFKKTN